MCRLRSGHSECILVIHYFLFSVSQMEETIAFEAWKHVMYNLGLRKQYRPNMIALQVCSGPGVIKGGVVGLRLTQGTELCP